jgi:hypothetical protein
MKYRYTQQIIKSSLLFIICSFIIVITPLNLSADFFRTEGKEILDQNGDPIILRGLGLGGWLVPEGYMLHTPGFGSPTSIRNQFIGLIGDQKTDEFFELYKANYVNENDIKAISEMGFNSLRLPFHYQIFYDTETEAFDEEGFQLLDDFLSWCKDYDLYVILDMHCAPGGQSKDNIADGDGVLARLWTEESNKELTIEIWTEIARRYADEEIIIGYDLLNEPVLPEGYNNTVLRALYLRIISQIRTVDSNHIVFIEGNTYATDFSSLTPPMDTNLVYSFHKYWSETGIGTIQQYLTIRYQFNAPLWMGESGENSNSWFYETIQLLEENNVGWNWWTHKKIETITSPYSSPYTDEYKAILNYLSGSGPEPTTEFAETALFGMAENLALDKCIYRPDVVAAITDSNFNKIPMPYKELKIPGIIDAVDYDIGNIGLTYWDTDYEHTDWQNYQAWNTGYQYRNDGVDIEESDDSKGAEYNIGWIDNGEWISYTVNVEVSGSYRIQLRVASATSNGSLRLLMDNTIIANNILIPNTGGWKDWETIEINNINFTAGKHIFEMQVINEGFNLNRYDFLLDSTTGLKRINENSFMGNNYPNPFNGSTKIPLVLLHPSNVKVEIYNIRGQLVKTLLDKNLAVGLNELIWKGKDNSGKPVASGAYYCMININTDTASQKILYLR